MCSALSVCLTLFFVVTGTSASDLHFQMQLGGLAAVRDVHRTTLRCFSPAAVGLLSKHAHMPDVDKMNVTCELTATSASTSTATSASHRYSKKN